MENYGLTTKRHVSIKLVLACLLWHAIVTNGYKLRTASTSIKLLAGSYKIARQTLSSSSVIFGSCKTLAANENETSCLFGMVNKSNVGSPEHVRYCNFTHTRVDNENRDTKGTLDQIVANDEDKAAFKIGYWSRADLSIIHFSDCRVIPVDVSGVTYPYMGTPFNGTFDIFSFKKGKDARAVVDFDGNFIEEHREIKEPLRYLQDVVRSPVKGYLAVRADRIGGDVELVAYNSEGSMTMLKRYMVDLPRYDEVPSEKYTFSVIDQLVTVCGQRDSKVRCAQFDQNGLLKFEITIPFTKTSNKYIFDAHNLPGGGMLFVSLKCVHARFTTCSQVEDHITVTVFDDTGRQVGSLQMKEVETVPKDIRASNFFMNEKKEICSSFFGGCHESGPCMSLNVVCFTGEKLIS